MVSSALQWLLFMGLHALHVASTTNDGDVKVKGNVDAMIYLSQFGYLQRSNPQTGSLISEDTVIQAIMEFQAFAGLNITGELDPETVKTMSLPRCGVKDMIGFGTNARRRKRYALQGSRWRVKSLTYQITKYPLDLTKAEVDRDIKQAFKVWEEVTDLIFVESSNSTDKIHIEIRFEKGEHGDGDAFDGPGGTLAHAYFPIYGGDAHFDSSETWTVNSYRGTNLFQVAAHEFGHSLGLSHSDNQGALMAPFYRGYQPNFKLHSDDISGIQSLYGKKVKSPEGSSGGREDGEDDKEEGDDPTVNSGGTELCSGGYFDAIVTMSDQKTYVFKGENYYLLNEDGVESDYPRSISEDFGSLEGNLDAAFTWKNGKTYFFKGDKYWRFTEKVKDKSYPKSISKGFSGIPNNVDTAFVWSGNGKIYFMKGTEYWRFDPTLRPPVKRGYPKLISNWEGLPNYLDGALQYSNGYTYFFKGTKYYRFNDRAFRVDKADPPFPRDAGYWWFGCPDKGNVYSSEGMVRSPEQIMAIPGADDVHGDDSFDAAGSDSNNVIPSNMKSNFMSGELKQFAANSAISRDKSSVVVWKLSQCFILLFLKFATEVVCGT